MSFVDEEVVAMEEAHKEVYDSYSLVERRDKMGVIKTSVPSKKYQNEYSRIFKHD